DSLWILDFYWTEQEHRLKVLFQVLDVNGDGGICINDLTIGLKKLGVHRTEHELMVRGHISAFRVRECFCFSSCPAPCTGELYLV
uniref:EF-hand domain-containing protein n=1 Tax=Stegastes partitus TaxID=144197 RepID=A0A3B4Z7P7_9TELE